jgi:hypothetical protein
MFVHEASIAAQSPALKALVQGPMSESQAGEVKWEDIDQGTFARFIEFAYTGDYSVPLDENFDAESDGADAGSDGGYSEGAPPPPLHIPAMTPEPDPEPEAAGAAVDWNDVTFTIKERNNGFTLPIPPPPAFASLPYPAPIATSIFTQLSAGKAYHMDNRLLLHASLYVLAEKWGIDRLKQLALSKLHQQLIAFDLSEKTVGELVSLVRYSYLHTPDLEQEKDKLRELVCQYVANKSMITGNHSEFAALLEDGGPFVSDLWAVISLRVRTAAPSDPAGDGFYTYEYHPRRRPNV